jgi:hypothetical protein
MALSLDSIYKPLSDFFITHFKTSENNPVFFRFAKSGRVMSDGDFVDPNFPGQYSPAKAREYFSDLVNSIPIDDPEGQNIFFTQNNVDEMYHDRLLGPALPLVPPTADDETKQNIADAFNQIKAEALKTWENIKAESSTGLMMTYKPSLAAPENWYDSSKSELWTPYSFHMEESVGPAAPQTPKFQLWKLRLNDDQLLHALPVLNTPEPVKPTTLVSHAHIFNPALLKNLSIPAVKPASPMFRPAGRLLATRAAVVQPFSAAVADIKDQPAATLPVRKNFHDAFWGLNVKNRLLVSQYIKTQAPTEPVTASSFSISFKYCVIDVDRPWLKTSFINDKSWFIPTAKKGELSGEDPNGGTLTLLPIAFIAIKELSIEANWSNTDIEISKFATDFGPFQVDTEILNNKLSHQGIQIVGWMVQKMPDLPPNDSL